MSHHAIASPSGASGWMHCHSWRADSSSSEFAREGTAAHELAQRALDSGNDARAYIGSLFMADGEHVEVTPEMAADVQPYIDYVRDLVKTTGGTLLVEQRLSIEHLTTEVGAVGTSDAVILAGDELISLDFKFGRGVKVGAEHNPQLQIYALAALRQFNFLGDFERVRMVIHQPRLNHVSEWTQTIDQLDAFSADVMEAASAMLAAGPDTVRNPGEKQCRWCAKKATCQALAAHVRDTLDADFDAVVATAGSVLPDPAELPADDLATKLAATDLIEHWLAAVRGEAERRLLAGQPVPGFKLVEGRRGARRWTDPSEVEAALKAMRLRHEQMFVYTLISPTTAEKLVKAGDLGERQWTRLQQLTTQSEGKPSVAPESDKRPSLQSAINDFDLVA